jgi:pimeloyl-ACP methyl ester carboxylesterase
MDTDNTNLSMGNNPAAMLVSEAGTTAYKIIEPNALAASAVDFVFLHGAGPAASMALVQEIAKDLAQAGYRSVIFDAFGHGASTGALAEQSLTGRTDQARYVLKHLTQRPVVLVGFSMGGHVAAMLATEPALQVAGLVLCAPAAYARDAEQLEFGDGFTEAIRRQDSWKDAAAYGQVAKFDGPVLLCVPEFDKVIPAGVTEAYEEALTDNMQAETIIIPGASHRLGAWFTQNDTARAAFVDSLVALAGVAAD